MQTLFAFSGLGFDARSPLGRLLQLVRSSCEAEVSGLSKFLLRASASL